MRLGLYCLCSTILSLQCTVRVGADEQVRVVSFVGASETAGYGLRAGELSYPTILERRCGFEARVDGETNKPVLLRKMEMNPGNAVVFFISQFDAYQQPSVQSINTWLTTVRPAKVVIVEAPLLQSATSDLASYQRALYLKVDGAASQTRARIILLHIPQNATDYVQADGLHPNGRGQLLIADLLGITLHAMGLCPTK